MLWPKTETHKGRVSCTVLYHAPGYCFMSPFSHEKQMRQEAPLVSPSRHTMVTGTSALAWALGGPLSLKGSARVAQLPKQSWVWVNTLD